MSIWFYDSTDKHLALAVIHSAWFQPQTDIWPMVFAAHPRPALSTVLRSDLHSCRTKGIQATNHGFPLISDRHAKEGLLSSSSSNPFPSEPLPNGSRMGRRQPPSTQTYSLWSRDFAWLFSYVFDTEEISFR